MKNPLQLYNLLLDGLIACRKSVLRSWILERGWPDLPNNRKFNDLLAQLTPEQRVTVAEIVEQAREGGMHETLAYFHGRICVGGLQLAPRGAELPVESFDPELDFDGFCRCQSDAWREEQIPVDEVGTA